VAKGEGTDYTILKGRESEALRAEGREDLSEMLDTIGLRCSEIAIKGFCKKGVGK